jgi:hypothetical protein
MSERRGSAQRPQETPLTVDAVRRDEVRLRTTRFLSTVRRANQKTRWRTFLGALSFACVAVSANVLADDYGYTSPGCSFIREPIPISKYILESGLFEARIPEDLELLRPIERKNVMTYLKHIEKTGGVKPQKLSFYRKSSFRFLKEAEKERGYTAILPEVPCIQSEFCQGWAVVTDRKQTHVVPFRYGKTSVWAHPVFHSKILGYGFLHTVLRGIVLPGDSKEVINKKLKKFHEVVSNINVFLADDLQSGVVFIDIKKIRFPKGNQSSMIDAVYEPNVYRSDYVENVDANASRYFSRTSYLGMSINDCLKGNRVTKPYTPPVQSQPSQQ